MKKALITGIRGQDGAYLAELLLEKWYEVYGADRRSSSVGETRLDILWVADQVKIVYMDLLDVNNINQVIKDIQPDEVYNLAAQSFVWVSFDQPVLTADVDAMGVIRILEAIKQYCPECRFYQASTSEMFGEVQEIPQKEATPFYPRSPYGVAKLYGHWITKNYREAHGMYACSGILFNHESPLRWLEFVTRKITHAVAKISKGKQEKLVLGNMEAKRDWGYAKEYVEGMRLMLQQETADDYVLATGNTYTVRSFVENSFAFVGIEIEWEWEGVDEIGKDKATGKTVVSISEDFYRPAEVELLVWDPSKAKKDLWREAKTDIAWLTKLMVEYDLSLVG